MTEHLFAQTPPDASPDASDLWTVGATTNVREISVWWNGMASVHLYWGDGPLRQQIDHNVSLVHAYPAWGAYRIQAREIGGQARVLADTVVVIRPTKPPVDIQLDPDHPMTVVVHAPEEIDETEIIPRYYVQFGRIGTGQFWGVPGASLRRTFDQPGRLPVRVQDLHSRAYTQKVLYPEQPDLAFTVTAAGATATLTVTHATPGKDLVVRWGDGGAREPVPDNTTATHTYPPTAADTTYLVQLGYHDASGSDTKPLTIPGGS